MNVVIYARYSSHNQTEASIEGQLKVCYEYAKRNNYNVIGEYIDRAMTGTNDNRPEFLKMIEDSNRRHFNGVLVYQLDRFARNRYDSATYKNKLKKNGIRVLSARENISEDASGVLMESVLEGMAEYFSAELSQKVKRGMGINASKCLYNGGTIPLGFKIDNDKKYQIDDDTSVIVKQIFEMYTNGDLMADIIRYLNNHNIKTSTGNEFNKNSIRNILINKRYIGTYTYNGIDTANAIPRIIDNETFYKVQDIMLKNKKAPARARAKNEYLLTTKLFCGHCKDMMTGFSGTSKTGRLYNYYTCRNAKNKLCDKKNIQKNYIEGLVVDEARKTLTDENISKIAHTVVELTEKEKDMSNLKRLNKLLKDNEKQRNNLFESLKICDIENVRKSIFEEISKMDVQHKEIENEILLEETQYVKVTVPQVKFFLTHLRNGSINDLKYRKMLINVLINQIYLYDSKITIIFNTQDKPIEIEVSLLNDMESSFMASEALPISDYANIVYFLGEFAVDIVMGK